MPSWEQIRKAMERVVTANREIMDDCLGDRERIDEFTRAFAENMGVYSFIMALDAIVSEDYKADPIDIRKALDISDVN